MERDEALAFLEKKNKIDESKALKYTERIASVRSHIKLVLRTIQEVSYILIEANGSE